MTRAPDVGLGSRRVDSERTDALEEAVQVECLDFADRDIVRSEIDSELDIVLSWIELGTDAEMLGMVDHEDEARKESREYTDT